MLEPLAREHADCRTTADGCLVGSVPALPIQNKTELERLNAAQQRANTFSRQTRMTSIEVG